MLPWMNRKSGGSVSAEMKDGKVRDEGTLPMHGIAKELIDAVHAKDIMAVANALEAAVQLTDSMPHEEGPHLGE